jgi:peptide/nickel transport system substrate-binding protein
LAFRAGEIDLDPYITDPRSFAATSGAKLLSTPDCASDMFSMNTMNAPWNDVHVRRAVAYALDRTAIIAAGGGYASPNYTLIPAQLLRTIASPAQVDSLLQSIPRYPYDVARARQEMAQSKYPHGFSTTLVEYTGAGQLINQSQVIAAELQKIGIIAQIKENPIAAWEALAGGPAGKRPTAFIYSGCTAPDPSNYTTFLGSWGLQPGGSNLSGYAPPAVDTMINASVAATDPARRFAVYSQLLQRLGTDVPVVPLDTTDLSIALSSRFSYSGLSFYYLQNGPYALNIKPAA